MLLIGDGICKRVRGNRFKIFIDNFNGIHVVLGIQNAVHIAGDCVTQNFELFHRYGLMAINPYLWNNSKFWVTQSPAM